MLNEKDEEKEQLKLKNKELEEQNKILQKSTTKKIIKKKPDIKLVMTAKEEVAGHLPDRRVRGRTPAEEPVEDFDDDKYTLENIEKYQLVSEIDLDEFNL